jgi:hypothetical protein
VTKQEIRRGATVYHGSTPGTVEGFSGMHGVRVRRLRKWTNQDFITGRLQPMEAIVSEVWPIRSVTATAPVEVEGGVL